MKAERLPNTPPSFNHRGLSLIELMIALLIGMLITAGILYLFQGSKQSFRYGDTMARMQENGRLALDAIGGDLRLIAFSGCRSVSNLAPQKLVASPNIAFDDDTVVGGRTYSSSDPVVGANGVNSSHIITLKHVSESSARLAQDMTSPSSDLVFAKDGTAPKFYANQIITIASCDAMDIFRATNVAETSTTITVKHETSGNTSADLSATYTTFARLAGYVELTYYVRNTGRVNNRNQAIYGLFRRATLNQAVVAGADDEEIAEGINDLRITYGLDTDGDGSVDSYAATESMAATQWTQVISVRVEMLIASVEDNVLDAPQTYTFNGVTTTSTDRKMRTSFGSTFTLRNRIR